MMKKTLMFSALAAATLTGNALAQNAPVRDNGFSYTYGQLGYDRWDYDNGLDVDALTAEGAFALDEHIFLRGGVSFYDGDYKRSRWDDDVDGHRMYIGAGMHTPLNRGLDLELMGDVIYDDNDFDDEMGYALRAGLRHRTLDMVELSGGVVYEDIYDDQFGVYGQGLLNLTPAVDVGARITLADDVDTFGVFGRYNF
ncbi:hypothetical protein A6D6_04070 [Alcanivorax xiamenensis]|uniref:Outer membrane protein beta-barrel domain-containing protein n=1 Tax=Alcanivorax xiamenensis TaxID=1177156 RepID=A0ABQ6Y2I5_9GAMM|nr:MULTISPECIES: hypothetical protein [Alcanivorax]KAF0802348.1 hypothetical protein A6D6_04070 [Alcanivorax xiamenensis]